MVDVYLSLGSNIEREANIRRAEQALQQAFGCLTYSPVYETEAVGFSGDNFYNSVVAFKTELPALEIVARLKKIEDGFGRDRSQPKFSARVIDIDLLLYGDVVTDADGIHLPREEILYNAFVLKPLADIAADYCHPVVGKTLKQLWLESDLTEVSLIKVDFKR